MSTQICNPCAEGQVCLDNLDRYSLQDEVYYQILNCPPNFFCGGNNVMYLVCCDGTIEQTTFTAGMTAAQRQSAISALVARCLMKDAFCTGTDTDPNNGDGTNGRPGNDPNDPIQLYGNRPMSSTSRCADGSPFTYTVPAGLFFARTQAAADAAALNYARTLSSSLKICLTGPLRTCCNNVAYSSTMVASGGVPGDFRWSVSGSLPTGLVAIPIGHNGLRIQGIPITNGNYTFTVRATDAAGNYMGKVITIKVWGITDTVLPDAFTGIAYIYQIPVTNGTAPYTFSIVSGAFPTGLTMGPDGIILGTPTETGNFTIGIRVVDAVGRTCTKELTLEVPEDCSSIAGESTQTWSYSDLPLGNYEIVSALRLVKGADYWGKNFEFNGTEGAGLLVETSSPDTANINHCVYIQLDVNTVNMGTGEITFTGTHNWTVDCFLADFALLMHKTGPNAGVQTIINSNTANTIVVNNPATFAPGDEVMIIKYNAGASTPFWLGALPATERYHVEVGIQLQVGDENLEWTYDIECLFAVYDMTWQHGTANVVGFTPYGSADNATYVRYLKCASTASSSGLVNIDASDVRQWTGALSGAHEYNHSGTLLTQIQENLTDILPDPGVISGNLSSWNAPGLPTIPTSGSLWGWYDNIAGWSVLPVWTWTTPTSTTGTAALSGSGLGNYNDGFSVYIWTTTLTGTTALTIPFDAQQGALAQFAISTTNDVRENTFTIEWPPTWDVNHWEYTGSYLVSYNTEVHGLTIGNTYKVTVELIDADTLVPIDTDIQTFVAIAQSHTLVGTIAASATDIILGQTLNMLKPVVEDITP